MTAITTRRRGRRRLQVAVIGVAAALLVVPQSGAGVDLLSEWDLRIDGAAAGDGAGLAVSGAGDVNGDATPDLLVAAPEANSAYVIFADPAVKTVDLASLGPHGYRIHGARVSSVANAGDVNGDGTPDALIGAQFAGEGSAYVVFGRSTTTEVDLTDLDDQGYRIAGGARSGEAGASVANAGDVNEDGIPDAVVGAPAATLEPESTVNRGAAFVIFGKATTDTVELDVLGTQGYRMYGASFGDRAGTAVASAGDVNDDGAADVLVGAPIAPYLGPSFFRGVTYVVFGKGGTASVNLGALDSQGFRILGAEQSQQSGTSVASTDVNGDGLPDVLVGAGYSGSAWVVFNVFEPPPYEDVDLSALGGRGYRIQGAGFVTGGTTVAAAGDLDDDGRGDVLLGSTDASANGRDSSGAVLVLLDRGPSGNVFPVSYRIDGAAAFDFAGKPANAGDVNGDGRPDAIVGAPYADNNGRSQSGSAYVVYGRPANDDLGDAGSLTGNVGVVAQNTAGATAESSEPAHAGEPGGRSMWYRWVAPFSGRVTFDTCDSDFDTLLAAYTGSGLGALTPVAGNDDGCGAQSLVAFDATQGTSYWIAVDGWNGAVGRAVLLWLLAPPNDEFGNASPLGGAQGEASGTTIGADRETGEPPHGGEGGTHSVWFRWAAPFSGTATFGTCDSGFDTLLAVYTGASVGSLTRVADNDDACGVGSVVTFYAVSGQTYSIAVDGFDGDAGDVVLDWLLAVAAPSNTSRPTVSGEPLEGGTLVGAAGTWLGTAPIALSSTWLRCGTTAPDSCTPIPGATTERYRLAPADVGKQIRMRATARNSAGAATSDSDATAVVAARPPASLAAPVVRGTPRIGAVLTTDSGRWGGTAPISRKRSWQRCRRVASSCARISGATGESYRPTARDAGRRIRVVVTATNGVGSARATSRTTAPVRRSQRRIRRAGCVVPDVRGKTIAGARAALARAGCRLGRVRRTHSARMRPGRISAQRPRPGTRLVRGGLVDVTVSR